MLLVDSFTENQWRSGDEERHCKDCPTAKGQQEKTCSKCKESKTKAGFTPKQWQQGAEKRRCEECVVGVHPKAGVTCRGCQRKKPRTEFTLCKASYVGTRLGRCNDCVNEQQREERAVTQSAARTVQSLAVAGLQKKWPSRKSTRNRSPNQPQINPETTSKSPQNQYATSAIEEELEGDCARGLISAGSGL